MQRPDAAPSESLGVWVIELEGLPELRNPVLIAAFEGWNDAGEAASGALDHLEDSWGAQEFAALDPEDYYDFQVNRPQVYFNDDGDRELSWPTTRFLVATLPASDRDVVLVRGIEPSMRWRSFATDVLGVARDLGVELVVTLGALLADVPHTRPVPVTGTSADRGLARSLHLEPNRYEGPTGIVGVLQHTCTRAELPSLSLWAAIPHYAAQSPCPEGVVALCQRITGLLHLDVPLDGLRAEAAEWRSAVDELVGGDPELAEYVRSLEETRDVETLPAASGEEIAREFERYLRHRDPEGPQP